MRVFETYSPFVPVKAPEGSAEAGELEPAVGGELLVDLLASPQRVVERLLDRERLQDAVLGSLLTIALGTAFFSLLTMSFHGGAAMARSAGLAALNTLLGLGAALGPIYAAGVLLACRIPLAKLIGALLSSAATGSLLLAGLAPIGYFLYRLDRGLLGPLALVACFGLCALLSGARLKSSLALMAEQLVAASGKRLTVEQEERVEILARNALVMVSFTCGLAFWAFDSFSVLPGGAP